MGVLNPLSALEIAGGKGNFLSSLLENGFKPGTTRRKVALAKAEMLLMRMTLKG